MYWQDIDDKSDIPYLVQDELNESNVQKLYQRILDLIQPSMERDDFVHTFFDEDGYFTDYIIIDTRDVELNFGPQPFDCHGPWHDVIVQSEEFSVSGSYFNEIDSDIQDLLDMSDEDFIDTLSSYC